MTNATRLIVLAAALGLAVGAGRAEAGIIIDINQVGSDVVATGSGTIDLTGLTPGATTAVAVGTVTPTLARIIEGPDSSTGEDTYTGAMGPRSFGPGGRITNASPGSGDLFGVQGTGDGFILVPHGYVSGTMLSATDTYGGQTFSSLGLTPGTYTYHWGTGVHADSLTVQIGPAAAVPEPSTLAGGAIGIALALGYAWRRHRRAKVMA